MDNYKKIKKTLVFINKILLFLFLCQINLSWAGESEINTLGDPQIREVIDLLEPFKSSDLINIEFIYIPYFYIVEPYNDVADEAPLFKYAQTSLEYPESRSEFYYSIPLAEQHEIWNKVKQLTFTHIDTDNLEIIKYNYMISARFTFTNGVLYINTYRSRETLNNFSIRVGRTRILLKSNMVRDFISIFEKYLDQPYLVEALNETINGDINGE